MFGHSNALRNVHSTSHISYFFSLMNSPFPFTHSFNSPRTSLRSLTLDDVTFTANLFSVSETCPYKHKYHPSALTVCGKPWSTADQTHATKSKHDIIVQFTMVNTVTTTMCITPCSVTVTKHELTVSHHHCHKTIQILIEYIIH